MRGIPEEVDALGVGIKGGGCADEGAVHGFWSYGPYMLDKV